MSELVNQVAELAASQRLRIYSFAFPCTGTGGKSRSAYKRMKSSSVAGMKGRIDAWRPQTGVLRHQIH